MAGGARISWRSPMAAAMLKARVGAVVVDGSRCPSCAAWRQTTSLLIRLDRLLRWRGWLLIDIDDGRPWPVGREARSQHQSRHGVDRRRIRPWEPPDMAFGREQRRHPLFVGLIPDLRIGAAVCEQ